MSGKSLVGYTKKLLISPPKLTPEDLFDSICLILKSLEVLEFSDDKEGILQEYVHISSFLSSLRTSGLDHKAEYIAQAAKAVLKYSDKVDLKYEDIDHDTIVLDIVGTGGDGQNTFNVSTSAAIVASGIPGLKICKHGGKASTSNSGAGDLINTLGCDSSKITNKTVPLLWNDKLNTFMFLLAPYFHNGMKYVADIRKQLGTPTIFNVLGPLLHPVKHVNKRILGVYSKELALEYAKAAQLVYPDSETFVVWGQVGLDEVSPIGKSNIWHVSPASSQIVTFELDPSLFGLQEHQLSECASYGPVENARILKEEVLSGKYNLGDNHAIYDYILLNTAVLYCLSQGHTNWKEGIVIANESIQSGAAKNALSHFIAKVQEL